MRKINSKLDKLLFQLAGEKYRDFLIISLSWKDVVGELLAARTKVKKFKKNVLYVTVEHPAWMTELVIHRPLILEQLKEQTKLKIDNILFST